MISAKDGAAIDVPPRARAVLLTARVALRRRNALVYVALVVLGLAVLCAAAPRQLAPYEMARIRMSDRLQVPSWHHPFGTDNLGRDLLSRVIFGARPSLFIGASVAVTSSVLGAVVGLAAGRIRALDNPLMRFLDGLTAFPSLLLVLALIAALGTGLWQEIIALIVGFFPRAARVMRAVTLRLNTVDFVEAAVACGATEWRVLWHHIMRNGFGALLVQATYVLAVSIVVDAGLSFLGLGLPPPTPTWGNILGDGHAYMQVAWWFVTLPGIALVATVVSVNILADVLRDVLDPRLRGTGG
jgi:peptide/nickel transport system permease protein